MRRGSPRITSGRRTLSNRVTVRQGHVSRQMDRQERDADRELSAEALREWEGHVEHVLRGLAHALNNRATAVSAVLELSNEPDHGVVSASALLTTEVQRLLELVDVVRTIGESRGEVEAFEPRDAASTARLAIGLHADLRECPVAIDVATAAPVRTHRWMFVRALIALAASAAPERAAGAITVVVTEDDGWVVVRAAGAAAPSRLSPYTAEIVRAMGGEPLPGALAFRLPTLAALRRREGR